MITIIFRRFGLAFFFVVVFKSPDQMGILGSVFFCLSAARVVSPTAPIPAAIVEAMNFLLLNKFLPFACVRDGFCFFCDIIFVLCYVAL